MSPAITKVTVIILLNRSTGCLDKISGGGYIWLRRRPCHCKINHQSSFSEGMGQRSYISPYSYIHISLWWHVGLSSESVLLISFQPDRELSQDHHIRAPWPQNVPLRMCHGTLSQSINGHFWIASLWANTNYAFGVWVITLINLFFQYLFRRDIPGWSEGTTTRCNTPNSEYTQETGASAK